MKTMNPAPRYSGATLAAVLALGIAGCAAPEFVVEGTFARPLKEFQRIGSKPAVLALEKAPTTREQTDGALAFAGEFGSAVVHRLHRWNVLDASDGPWLLLDVRILKYEWEFSEGSSDSPPRATGWINVSVTFKDEAGNKLGTGTVAAAEFGSSPQSAMERTEKRVITSVTKFIRKAVGRRGAKEVPEPPELDVSPSR